ncbi:MAG: class I SAM-dependent methyltransferase [Candidatus Dormibacteraeota bacterium]|nr:class I SAM-dependent methyltransferase [Candidatus Dormibacteraeota bacterium]
MRLPTPARIARRARFILDSGREAREARRAGSESEKATAYWAHLSDYHRTNDDNPSSVERSMWVSAVVGDLGIRSVLEVGTNSGRNLQVLRQLHPALRLAGIDVNQRAIDFAKSKGLDIDFRVSDANAWVELPQSWDAILTMSVLDHIPDEVIDTLVANFASTAAYVIAVELWDGGHGTRGLYKYSRDNMELFERHGFRTLRWEKAVGQYDLTDSPLWAYVGAKDPGVGTEVSARP